MSQESKIEVINREGWRKEYPLQKGIVYIGSAPTNDIVLDNLHGAGVAPLHIQLIAAGDAGYKLVNLSDQEIFLGSSGSEILPPRAVMNLPEGMSLRLGEFTLIFRGGPGVNYGGLNNGSGSSNIGLRLSLPYTRLAPNQTLVGTATIRNLGGKTGARFDVVLEGLDEDCFDIEPGPLLSSGAEKDISFRLYHHGARPLAGEWTFVIRATSSNAYPGEQAQLFQTIEILPLYHHRLQLLPAKGIKVTSPPQTTPLPGSLKPKAERRSAGPEATTASASARPLDRSVRARPQSEPEPEVVQEEWWSTSIIDEELPPAQRSDVRHLKAQAVAPPPVPVTPVEPEEDPQDLQSPPASATTEAGEEWGWAVKEETPQPRPAPAEVVSPPLEPPPPASRTIEPEPAQAAYQPEEPEPPVVPPARALPPEPELEAFRPPEAEAAPVVPPQVYYHEEVQPSPPSEAPPSPAPKPAPPEVQPVAEPSLLNKWWNRLKEAVPFLSQTTEPDRAAEPVAAERSSSETVRDATLRPAPSLGDFAEEPQGEAAITERPLLAADEPERQDEVVSPITSYSQPTGEAEEQPEWEIQTGTVEPVYQVPEPPVEEPASEPEPVETLKPSPQTTEFEDWWADEVEPAPPAEVSPALQTETSSSSEQPAAAVESPPKTEEWWETIEVRARGKTEENPVIKLKANPAQVKQPPETRAKTNEAEEWWTVDMETSPEQPDKKQ